MYRANDYSSDAEPTCAANIIDSHPSKGQNKQAAIASSRLNGEGGLCFLG